MREYSARWNPELRTPEIALPPQCPATLPENIETWRKNWQRWAGARVAGADVAEDAAEGAKAAAHNKRLTHGRLADFAIGERSLGEVIFEDLQQAIVLRFPDHVEAVEQTDLQRELDLQEELIAAATEGFIGRAADLAALDEYADSDDARLFAVAAAGGIGKTTLLAKWIADRRERADVVFCRFIGVGDRSNSVDSLLASLLDELQETGRIVGKIPAEPKELRKKLPELDSRLDELRRAGRIESEILADPKKLREKLAELPELDSLLDKLRRTGRIDSEIPTDPRKLREQLPELLAECGKRGRAIIVIDALNQLDSGLEDLDWLPKRMPAGLKMMVSFKTGTAPADKLLARWRACGVQVHECRGFEDIEDRKKLVTGYLERHLKELDQAHLATLGYRARCGQSSLPAGGTG